MQPVEIILIAVLVIYVIGRRLAGEPLQARRLLLMPAILVIWGCTQLGHPGPAAIAVLAAEGVLGLAVGAVRGTTIAVYERGGHLWYRYRPATIAVWVASIGVRVAAVLGAGLLGVTLPTTPSLLVTFGISLLGEAAVVAVKAQRSGVPYAPDRRTARAAAAGLGMVRDPATAGHGDVRGPATAGQGEVRGPAASGRSEVPDRGRRLVP